MRYRTIVSDPPWSFDDELKKMKDGTARSAASQYNTLPTSVIEKLPVNKLVEPDGSLLALWVPSVLLEDGLRVMRAWGFDFKQTWIWVKCKKVEPMSKKMKKLLEEIERTGDFDLLLAFGMGRLFRQTHEIALIGTTSTKIYQHLMDNSQRSVIIDANEGHSKKPEGLQDSLEAMFPEGNRLEMFARRVRLSWECVGNEINGEDIRDSLDRLIVPPGEGT